MSGHTPGPWRWLSADTLVGDHGHRPVVLTRWRKGLAQRDPEGGLLRTFDPDSPDARLIAAAPDLLAALKVVTNTDDHADPEVRATVRAAIAKAEGEP
jgi:hypothetical protein